MAIAVMQESDKLAEEVVAEEKKIPVFAVLKNNSILKNIFLIDKPPSPPSSSLSNSWEKENLSVNKEELEEILVVGRHPDCSITLEHPSISRFHLRIHSIPSVQSLSIFDLSSVHGTWVSGKKIEPGVRVELREGDTLQLGGSSRVYKLHWVPLSEAYDFKNPLVVPMDELEQVEESEEEKYQDQDGLCLQNDQSLTEDDDLEGLGLFTDMNIISQMKQLTPSAPLLPEDMRSPIGYDEEEAETKPQLQSSEIAGPQPLWQSEKENCIPNETFSSENSPIDPQPQNPNSPPQTPQLRSGVSIWKRRGKSASVQIQTSRGKESSRKPPLEFAVQPEGDENCMIESVSQDLFAGSNRVDEVFTPDKENSTPDTLLCRSFKKIGTEKKYEWSINSLNTCMYGDDEEPFTPDKENITPNTLLLRSMKKMDKLEELKHPKTYRSSPLKNGNSSIHHGMGKHGSLENRNQLRKVLQVKKSARPASRSQARLQENVNLLKDRADRVPFQSLFESPSSTNPNSLEPEVSTRSCSPINNAQIKEAIHHFNNKFKDENKRWTMVVDTACLLNKESRKALQLMQGLRGTRLIIPRIVIRELDCMKRRSNLFRRTTEVCSALLWIKDCMESAHWWIHVQSSMEDVRPTAPTPPATPLSLFSEEKEKFSLSSVPRSPSASFLEIVSPTTEDHILDCALFFRRIRNNGHLVLLSNDVTLKIKAMAEGLLCETAEEFRESLVNPFSERFLWTDSSPRGPTWSCLDDVVLREKYYNGPLKNPSKLGESTKGLKLILLHNTNFKQISSVS